MASIPMISKMVVFSTPIYGAEMTFAVSDRNEVSDPEHRQVIMAKSNLKKMGIYTRHREAIEHMLTSMVFHGIDIDTKTMHDAIDTTIAAMLYNA